MPEQHTLVLDGLPRSYAQAERLAEFIDVIQIFHLKIDNTAMADRAAPGARLAREPARRHERRGDQPPAPDLL